MSWNDRYIFFFFSLLNKYYFANHCTLNNFQVFAERRRGVERVEKSGRVDDNDDGRERENMYGAFSDWHDKP